jgi:plastocyanin/FtsP/CotA-like multicopper oxidase with cupredoxin domain
MATIEFWIQLENHRWEICPSGKDRLTGMKVEELVGGKPPVNVTLHSPVTGHTRSNVKMFQPVRDSDGDVADALILRRYTANWAAPDDRKINPWDINEKNPTDTGTMGTIPGPVIECSVGDSVVVHFRNMDMRTQSIFKLTQAVTQKAMSVQMAAGGAMGGMPMAPAQPILAEPAPKQTALTEAQSQVIDKLGLRDIVKFPFPFPFFIPLPVLQRTHSLHTHGFVFAPTSDGAYPLTPPDPTQPVGAEAGMWATVGVTGGFKQGDRVPPGGTFTYSWNTIGWPTTQGVWLYHDHSVCDTDNVSLGAIGIVVIHPPAGDSMLEQDVDLRQANGQLDPAFLPAGSPNGSGIDFHCFPFPLDAKLGVLPHFIGLLDSQGTSMPGMPGMNMSDMKMTAEEETAAKSASRAKAKRKDTPESHEEADHVAPRPEPSEVARFMQVGDLAFQLNKDLTSLTAFCISRFRTPPTKALYLQLYHEFANVGMSVNGRKYLGNTPTVLGGPTTKMKFGVVGMGTMSHTFHIHGHRWLIPGPSGTGTNALQFGGSTDTAVSQFEDTRLFGPANSFSFTINEGNSFMRASPPQGEWHMHCHVLAHMMDGMMGSLLIVNGGEVAPPFAPLPSGKPCPTMPMNMPPDDGNGNPTKTVEVDAVNGGGATGFSFSPSNAAAAKGDTILFKNISNDIHSVIWDTAGSPANGPNFNTGGGTWSVPVPNAGTFHYHCGVHGAGMSGTITVT